MPGLSAGPVGSSARGHQDWHRAQALLRVNVQGLCFVAILGWTASGQAVGGNPLVRSCQRGSAPGREMRTSQVGIERPRWGFQNGPGLGVKSLG